MRVYNSSAKISKGVLLLPPSDVYVRTFLYLLYTLIKLYYTKALSHPVSSMAPDWILLLWRPRTLATLCDSATTFQEEPDGLQSIGSHRVRHDGNDLALTHVVLIRLLLLDFWKFMIRFHRTKMLDCQGKKSLCKRTDLWLPRGRAGEGGGPGIRRCKLLHIE